MRELMREERRIPGQIFALLFLETKNVGFDG